MSHHHTAVPVMDSSPTLNQTASFSTIPNLIHSLANHGILGLPDETYLDLCNYLNLKDIEALSKTSFELRAAFNPYAWSHCTVLPDKATNTTIPCNYVYCNSRPITVKMLLYPQKFRSWFDASRVKHLYITWEALSDISQHSSVLHNNPSKFLISRFPHIQTIRLTDRHYEENDDQGVDIIYSLGGNMLSDVSEMFSFGDLSWVEIFRLFQSAPIADYVFSSVVHVRSIINETNVRSLSLVVSSLSQSENLLSNLRDPYFFEKLRGFRNLEKFALQDNSPYVDHISQTYPIAHIARSLNTLPKLTEISIHQPRYSVASLHAMNILRGCYEKCELVLSLLLDQVDERNRTIVLNPNSISTFKEGAVVNLSTVTHLSFKERGRHQICKTSVDGINETACHIVSRMLCPNLKSIKGIEISPMSIPDDVVFDSVTSLDALLDNNKDTRNIESSEPETSRVLVVDKSEHATSISFHMNNVTSKFPNVKTLKLQTQFGYVNSNNSATDNGENISNNTDEINKKCYNTASIIFKILGDVFTLELGELYESFVKQKSFYSNGSGDGLDTCVIPNGEVLKHDIESKFANLVTFCTNISNKWARRCEEKGNNKCSNLENRLDKTETSAVSSKVSKIAGLYLSMVMETDDLEWNTDSDNISREFDFQKDLECRVQLSRILKAEDDFNNGMAEGSTNIYSSLFLSATNAKKFPSHLTRLALSIPLLETYSTQIIQLLHTFHNSFGAVKLVQTSVLKNCSQVEYLQLDDYSFDLFHPHTILFLKKQEMLKQMLFYSPRNCFMSRNETLGHVDGNTKASATTGFPPRPLPDSSFISQPLRQTLATNNKTLKTSLNGNYSINNNNSTITSPPLYKYGPLYPYLYDIVMNRCTSKETLEHPQISTVLMVDQYHRKCASRWELLKSGSRSELASCGASLNSINSKSSSSVKALIQQQQVQQQQRYPHSKNLDCTDGHVTPSSSSPSSGTSSPFRVPNGSYSSNPLSYNFSSSSIPSLVSSYSSSTSSSLSSSPTLTSALPSLFPSAHATFSLPIDSYCPDLVPDVLSRTSHQNIVWPASATHCKSVISDSNNNNFTFTPENEHSSTTEASVLPSLPSTSLAGYINQADSIDQENAPGSLNPLAASSSLENPLENSFDSPLGNLLATNPLGKTEKLEPLGAWNPWDMAPSVTLDHKHVDCTVTQNIAPWFGESNFDGWL